MKNINIINSMAGRWVLGNPLLTIAQVVKLRNKCLIGGKVMVVTNVPRKTNTQDVIKVINKKSLTFLRLENGQTKIETPVCVDWSVVTSAENGAIVRVES